jgi:hypothetical protein
MKRRSVLASMGAFTASGSLVMGSGAFTSAEVERDVNIDVVGDPRAFLGLAYPTDGCESKSAAGKNIDDCESTPQTVTVEDDPETLFFIVNRFNTDIETFDVQLTEGSSAFTLKYPETIPNLELDKVEIQAECSENTNMSTVSAKITAEGTGVRVEAEREFPIDVDCESECITHTISGNNGNIKINVRPADGGNGTVVTQSGKIFSYPSASCLNIVIEDGATVNGGVKIGKSEIDVTVNEESGSTVNGNIQISDGLLESLSKNTD